MTGNTRLIPGNRVALTPVVCYFSLLLLFIPGCTTTYECECTRYIKYATGSSTSVTVGKIKEKNKEAARKKCEAASDSASSWGKEEKLNCKLRQK